MQIELEDTGAPFVTRFAPSPTGYLHLGHLASMAFVYGIARATKAKLLLRIEDHDRGRSRAEFEQAIFDDLEWAGFRFDDQPTFGTPHPLRQSDRRERYEEIIQNLSNRGLVYRCVCTRAEIQQQMTGRSVAGNEDSELFYGGKCRNGDHSRLTEGYGLRIVSERSAIAFKDGILGHNEQNPAAQCGDFLIMDRHRNFTYNFAVVVDDHDQGVNLVVRGEDLLHATGRQIYAARLIHRKKPAQFLHHPLIRDASGQKLGKRFFSEAIAKRRSNGEKPDVVLGEAAAMVGLIPAGRPLAADELATLFKISLRKAANK